MKKDTPSKMKFKVLKRRLGIPFYHVVGVLESIWRLTEMNAPAGDIGKLTNEEIAAGLEWEGDADQLVNILIECRWLDESDEFRLVVHDWSDHVPNWLKAQFKHYEKQFANEASKNSSKKASKNGVLDPSKNGSLGDPSKNPSTYPNLTQPNPTQPDQDGFASAKPRASDDATKWTAAANSVFDHYRIYHPAAFKTPKAASKEYRAVVARLKEGYSVDDLKLAIDGNHKSPWHCGENPGGKEYHDLGLIVRDGSKVNGFIEANAATGPVLSEKTRRSLRAADDFVREFGEPSDGF